MRKLRASTFVWGLFALGLGCGLGVGAGTTTARAQTPALWTEREAGGQRVAMPSLAELAKRLRPSIANVEVQTTGQVDPRILQFFQIPPEMQQGLGSAFIIHRDGLLLTNSHVVEQAERVRVKLADGTYHVAEVVGLDPPTDIALLRIHAGRPLPAVPLGDSDALEIGDWVVAIGNPFGLENTITAGIVSAKERHDITPSGRSSQYYSYIQTDAAINPGNSGGPLFNLAGEVVGINAAVNTMAQGLGFAIPINMAKELLPALHEHGSVRRSGIGIAIQPLTPELVESFRLESASGALVNEVVPGSPGANAGLRVGDVVVRFDGRPVRDAQTLPLLASTAGVGREVELVIFRSGERQTVRVRLNELPGQAQVQRPPAPPRAPGVGDTGMLVRDLQAGERRQVGRNGVLITQMDPNSAAAQAGVEREDVVVSVNGDETPDARVFLSTVTRTPQGQLVRLLLLHRDAQNGVYIPRFVAYRR